MPLNQRILLNTSNTIHFIWIQKILYCKCDNSYTTFYLTNHSPIVVSRSIKEFEIELTHSNFFRSHQSYLVNSEHVVKIDKTNGFTIIMSDNSRIPVSIRKRKEIMQILQNQ